ncbi:MAG: type I-E CRISPR-associated protein Cse1/CasA [Liquorilactobacillus ghanensis]|uniref:type I-E CRISPR-associated protein Cse1/CasA n=1 Tax=Liquorilactobacillus ghanensis TaxID=399370 RepID=UPI0039ED8A15
MIDKAFNLTTDPWIKVIENGTNKEKTVSLIEVFRNAQNYRRLAGEMRSQDLSILRFLLAILTTVYSRFNAENEPYDWLTIDENMMQVSLDEDDDQEIKDDLLDTWTTLYQNGHFTDIVTKYLKLYNDRFSMFGEHPFYQVTESEYNQFVPSNKQIKDGNGPGKVAVRQINRQVSESANTPAIFSPKSGEFKNSIKIDELVRWLITYQNFTGVTDKTKIKTTEKFSVSRGWLYQLNPVFAEGKTIFQTLMLNMILMREDKMFYSQKPVWEYESIKTYVNERMKQQLPKNIAELYTSWSRLLHIHWNQRGQPIFFSAGIPMFNNEDVFIEPMTTWRIDKSSKRYKPAAKWLNSLGTAMWRSFGQYVNVKGSDDMHEPGIVEWLHLLDNKDIIPLDAQITLASATLISDGNATSQAPVVEVCDDMHINADVLFDKRNPNYWPKRIEDTIELTQKVGTVYWQFAKDIATIRGYGKPEAKEFANRMSGKLYENLNHPFKVWLSQLTNNDDRDQRIKTWNNTLYKLVLVTTDDITQSSSLRDIRGIVNENGNVKNIFTANNNLRYNIRKVLNLK